MKCSRCEFENPEGMKFCGECGSKLERICPKCDFSNPSNFKFCGECGHDLSKDDETLKVEELEPKSPTTKPSADKTIAPLPAMDGERKYVTALFSDMSGYTAMSERFDPEEVKEITSRIFAEISQIVSKYDGFIEKFVGDAVMALFGAPKAHEDDPIRAIWTAREIHQLVQAISPELEEKVGKPLSMHTGINTGLVVTGEVDLEKGTHGVAGDTINVAARLSSLASPGEIVVGPETYRQAEGYFAFASLEPTGVKGKAEPIQVYRVLSPKEEPITIHRLHGLRADLIGRKVEMDQLGEAVQRLRQGKGGVFSICGDAGTGKSRLVEEFKATVDLNEIQWREGHAYAYSQNIPYFPLIDLLNRAWHIEEGDPPEEIKTKIELAIGDLIGERNDIVPYVGSLYSLSYPEIEGVSPEFWKSRLQEAIQRILSALAQRASTVICLEDIQWADPSSLDLLRFLLSELTYPVLFLCMYRPPFSLLTSHQLSSMGELYKEIRLQDLSSAEAHDMLESLLKTETVPSELRRFLQERVEGNPFYLEEVINALIESGTLARDNGAWKLTRSIREADIPSTIHGVISARLDRLEREAKRILQEASVIGKAFLYEILEKVTELKDQIDRCLSGLERLDLIRARSLEPELEYAFKHALTQEVVYNGLLKKERQEIHERIGCVIEQLFRDRLPEFSETLAFHFKHGKSIHKAVDYLMKSGEKSLQRYAVEESHQYFKEAFDLLSDQPEKTKEEEALLIDLLIKWSMVYYYRGDFKGQVALLRAHQELAGSLDDRAKVGMFYAWLGFSLYSREKFRESYKYIRKALEIGEEIGNQQVIGYACAWLSWTCVHVGRLDEAISFGERAQEIARLFPSDHYLYFKSLGGIGWACCWKGDGKRAVGAGTALVDYGRRYSNKRSMALGNWIIGLSYFLAGDFQAVIEFSKKAIEVSADPFYSQFSKLFMGMGYALDNQFQEAEEPLREVLSFAQEFGTEICGTSASIMLGFISIAKGNMGQGLKMIEEGQRTLENESRCIFATWEHALGQFYLQIVAKKAPISLSVMAKNVGFLLRNVPTAAKKAEEHLNKAIEVAQEIGAKTILGQACLDLGLLHKARGKSDQARECISRAVQIFEECEVEMLIKQAKEALASLK